MIGYPGETRERFLNSMSFCEKLKNIGTCSFTTFLTRAYPGTSLYKHCSERGYISSKDGQEIFLGAKYSIITEDFDEVELRWRLKYANSVLNDGKKQSFIL